MKERATLIGDGKSLVAITTEPPREAAVDDPTGIVLVSAGLVHRVGPNRLYVRLARRLAATGCPVLRFDLSGSATAGPVGTESRSTSGPCSRHRRP